MHRMEAQSEMRKGCGLARAWAKVLEPAWGARSVHRMEAESEMRKGCDSARSTEAREKGASPARQMGSS